MGERLDSVPSNGGNVQDILDREGGIVLERQIDFARVIQHMLADCGGDKDRKRETLEFLEAIGEEGLRLAVLGQLRHLFDEGAMKHIVVGFTGYDKSVGRIISTEVLPGVQLNPGGSVYRLIALLLANDRIVTNDEIERFFNATAPNASRQYIFNARKKLRECGSNFEIVTMHGQGYCIKRK